MKVFEFVTTLVCEPNYLALKSEFCQSSVEELKLLFFQTSKRMESWKLKIISHITQLHYWRHLWQKMIDSFHISTLTQVQKCVSKLLKFVNIQGWYSKMLLNYWRSERFIRLPAGQLDVIILYLRLETSIVRNKTVMISKQLHFHILIQKYCTGTSGSVPESIAFWLFVTRLMAQWVLVWRQARTCNLKILHISFTSGCLIDSFSFVDNVSLQITVI